jgi:cobalt-precorrin 5A hydrolase/precorrin-3B C17-methyltransferase
MRGQAVPVLPRASERMMHPVIFVGAGPGATDLITLRGLRALEQADLVLYAGSLVNRDLLRYCRPHCECLDSAPMHLEEQIAVMRDAVLAGRRVLRLHTGDPAIYGAINEQIRLLREEGIATVIVPGVSSVFAAAAALGCELTSPGQSQSIVLTRSPGRTAMPAGEDAAVFARSGATLAFFLSAGQIETLMQRLVNEGGLAPDTPAALVYRASWPDERILRGSVSDLAARAGAAGIGRQAIILVGRALAGSGGVSRLYDADFSHGYRNHLPAEEFAGSCAIYAFADRGLAKAQEIAAALGLPTTLYATCPSDAAAVFQLADGELDAQLAANWHNFQAHIFMAATGIVVRKIAPLLGKTGSTPAVLACAAEGSHIVSLTDGILGSADRLARRIARITGGQAVTGSGPSGNLPVLEQIVRQEGARLLNTENLEQLNAALQAGDPLAFCGRRSIYERHFASMDNVFFVEDATQVSASHAIFWDREVAPSHGFVALHVSSRAFVLGLGCRRGVDAERLRSIAEKYLCGFGLHKKNIAIIASCDLKADEKALWELGSAWQIPLEFHDVAALDAVPVPNPSPKVREKIRTASVCEAACLLSAGYGAGPAPELVVPKQVFDGITLALARLPHLAASEKQPGQLTVVGLGSGAPGQITPDVSLALQHCDVVAGYDRYLDLIRDRIAGKAIIRSGMKGEVQRCRAALQAARAGKSVCMVCSGDPGILAMAGLLYELRTREKAFASINIRVLPGITAASTAAAALGAPLQNGFSLVSLSDLLIPADEVRQNLHAAASSALPLVLYNPAGKKRRQMLAEALDIVRQYRPADTLCAYVRHAGRAEESKWIGRLVEFPADAVDMSTLVIIGGVHSCLHDGILYETRGYAQKYLQEKQ